MKENNEFRALLSTILCVRYRDSFLEKMERNFYVWGYHRTIQKSVRGHEKERQAIEHHLVLPSLMLPSTVHSASSDNSDKFQPGKTTLF